MRILGKLLLPCIGCIAASAAQAAMTLSGNGMGQVLLFPYYTVQGGQSSLISLVNTTDRVKVLDVRYVEALNGREVFGGYVYLGPHDTWVGVAFADSLDGPAKFVTDDRSCALLGGGTSQPLPDGRIYRPFIDWNYAGDNADRGPASLNRTREGSIEVVEIGQARRGTALETALTSATGEPACAAIAQYDPNEDIDAPGGGLYGMFAIVDAAQGTVMAGQPTAIDGFSVYPLFTPTNEIRVLDRGTTSTNPADPIEALVPVGNKVVSVKYPVDRAIDAVTALLMTDTLYGDFMKDASIGADTDWVISAPTKKYYADTYSYHYPWPREVLPPYRERFSEHTPGYSCMPYQIAMNDREQRTIAVFPELVGTPPPSHRYLYNLCFTVDVLRFDARGEDMLPGEPPSAPGGPNPVSPAVLSRLSAAAASIDDAVVTSGAARLSLTVGAQPAFLPAGVSGPALRGLPVIGFEATKYTTGSIGGVLANYTYAVPLRGRAACANAAGAEMACP